MKTTLMIVAAYALLVNTAFAKDRSTSTISRVGQTTVVKTTTYRNNAPPERTVTRCRQVGSKTVCSTR